MKPNRKNTPLEAGFSARARTITGIFRHGAAFTVLMLLPVLPAVADAPADLPAYCIARYGTDTQSGFDRRNNEPLCSQKTSQGLGLLHHKIDPADVCTTQQKTSRFRREGRQVICLTGSTPPAAGRKVDLADFCRGNYGQSAIISQRLTDNAPLCTVKGNGGLSQIHHVIDLAQLCPGAGPVGPEAVENNILDCAKPVRAAGAAGSQTGPPSKSADSGASTAKSRNETSNASSPTVPDTAIVSAADKPDLQGCGVPPYPELAKFGYEVKPEEIPPNLRPSHVALLQKLGEGWDSKSDQHKIDYYRQIMNVEGYWGGGGRPSPCPALSGGFVPDLAQYCRTKYANPEPNFLFWLPTGRPVCHPTDWSTQTIDPNTVHGMSTLHAISTFGLSLYGACTDLYPDQAAIRLRREGDPEDKEPGTLYPVLKFTAGKVECFYLDVAPNKAEGLMLWADE